MSSSYQGSIRPSRANTEHLTIKRIESMLLNFGIRRTDNGFQKLMDEGIAMRECGFTFASIEKTLEEKLDLMGMAAY